MFVMPKFTKNKSQLFIFLKHPECDSVTGYSPVRSSSTGSVSLAGLSPELSLMLAWADQMLCTFTSSTLSPSHLNGLLQHSVLPLEVDPTMTRWKSLQRLPDVDLVLTLPVGLPQAMLLC